MSEAPPDSLELERFRAEWRAELERRRVEARAATPLDDSARPQLTIPLANATPAPAGKASVVSAYPNAPLTASQGSALAVYRSAVDNERLGQMDDALRLYRIAFRKDPQVDRLYHREEIILAAANPKIHTHNEVAPPHTESAAPVHAVTVSIKTLANIVAQFPDTLSFSPEVEEEKVLLNELPDEILVKIVMNLDPTSLERFATVSRKARIFTLDSIIWRKIVNATYKPPQIADQDALDIIIQNSLYDYRRVFVEQPRMRTDGVYISVCHYVRAGLSESHWVNVNHLITYHRYLRFFANGEVISLRTHEGPSEVLHLVTPKSRMPGLFFGTWTLINNIVHITNLVEANDHHIPISLDSDLTEIILAHPESIKYFFRMSLTLQSRPIGRWNKLDITAFDSVRTLTGDILPVTTKHERPFWFSKVRSYA